MGIFIFLLFPITFALIANYLRAAQIKSLKNHIQNNGGEFVDLTWQPDLAFWKFNLTRNTKNDYLLTYLDENKKQHESVVSISVFNHEIISDRIVVSNNKASKKTQEEEIITGTKTFPYETGEITIQLTSRDIELGNKVLLNNLPAPNGKYKIGFLHYIYVKDGQVC